MGNEKITLVLPLDHLQALLNTLQHAPYLLVDSIGPIIAEIHNQAGPQVAEIQKAAAEAAESQAPKE